MSKNKTQMFIQKQKKATTLLLVDNRKLPIMLQLSGSATMGHEYPESDREIKICSEIAGRRHGELVYDSSEGAYILLLR